MWCRLTRIKSQLASKIYQVLKWTSLKANLHACFVDKLGSESAHVNGDPMRVRLQSDKSADSVNASQIFACRARF